MKKIIGLLFICLIICGCQKEKTYKDLMNENDYIILDVRTKEEYDEIHIKDSVNIPYDLIDDNLDIDKDLMVFVYCKSGKRADIAKEKLENLGYSVYNLGGINNIDLEKEGS